MINTMPSLSHSEEKHAQPEAIIVQQEPTPINFTREVSVIDLLPEQDSLITPTATLRKNDNSKFPEVAIDSPVTVMQSEWGEQAEFKLPPAPPIVLEKSWEDIFLNYLREGTEKENRIVTSAKKLIKTFRKKKFHSGWNAQISALFELIVAARNENFLGVPDVLEGEYSRDFEKPIVIFISSENFNYDKSLRQIYITLEMALSLGSRQGAFSNLQERFVRDQIQNRRNLSKGQKEAAQAYVDLCQLEPLKQPRLRARIDENFDTAASEVAAAFISGVAQADGDISPQKFRELEKLYKQLHVYKPRLYSDVHAAATSVVKPSMPASAGFVLDKKRIKILQEDTKQISSMLAQIFTEEEVVKAPLAPTPGSVSTEMPLDAHCAHVALRVEWVPVMGLKRAQSDFVRAIVTQNEWKRHDLQKIATDLGLMLDGALESINEAAFEIFDMPLVEGDDPVELRVEVASRIRA